MCIANSVFTLLASFQHAPTEADHDFAARALHKARIGSTHAQLASLLSEPRVWQVELHGTGDIRNSFGRASFDIATGKVTMLSLSKYSNKLPAPMSAAQSMQRVKGFVEAIQYPGTSQHRVTNKDINDGRNSFLFDRFSFGIPHFLPGRIQLDRETGDIRTVYLPAFPIVDQPQFQSIDPARSVEIAKAFLTQIGSPFVFDLKWVNGPFYSDEKFAAEAIGSAGTTGTHGFSDTEISRARARLAFLTYNVCLNVTGKPSRTVVVTVNAVSGKALYAEGANVLTSSP